MDVLVCVKRVPAVGAEILLTADGTAVDTRHLGFTIGPHEECAVEEAVRIAERTGGAAGVLTVGAPETEEQLRYAMSMGADHAVRVDAPGADGDPQATAAAITGALRDLPPYDLVLFGAASADAGHAQVGVRVACALRRPVVGGVKGIELDDGCVRLRREVGDGVEVHEAPLPAVVTVLEGLNLPRYPTIKGRLRAKKAPIRVLPAAPAAGDLRLRRLRHRPEARAATIVLGRGADAAPAVVDVLTDLGMVRR
ncbi:electron transfer flavoprotein subunit beta/FixA family protein [Actinomycetospora endophytica]|uniref:Electron transfer flavoprotein subunit beta/FixA family protein n=1 Tax=Actinomycetospora endophytica TaxID=2291215 RepID=A0ABS8PFH4_9PSEU|nr:electron transfer flavoprotein subunit beta/FixA family protein [Actinomycetospora endophytica]MCD2196702.1 electron transfer flavoprotein subunit beta/FixA family protein [Actinomycetospora endophytica]